MTRFEKDVREMQEGNEIEVLKRRKAELEELRRKGRCEKNGFKRQCIAQEYERKMAEYEKLGCNDLKNIFGSSGFLFLWR